MHVARWLTLKYFGMWCADPLFLSIFALSAIRASCFDHAFSREVTDSFYLTMVHNQMNTDRKFHVHLIMNQNHSQAKL